MKLPTIQENQDLQQAVDAKELYQSLGLDISNWSRWSAKNIAENPFAVQLKITYYQSTLPKS